MEYEAKQAVYFPVTDFLELELHLMETRPGVKLDVFVVELVKRWFAAEVARLEVRKNGAALRGFQWKTVFLPDGTSLRTSYGDNVEFAKVVGDRVICDDGAMSTPSLFANRHAQGQNAWRFVWLRFPGDDDWVRAGDCRERLHECSRKQSKEKAKLYKAVQAG